MRDKILSRTKKVKDIVEELLISDPRCRDDDLWLILQVWQKKQGFKVYIPYHTINDMIKPESITRARRKIQSEYDHLQPTKQEIKERRGLKESIYREFYRK